MKVLIDNGHGIETPGKRSPDGRFREYKYNREIARAVVEHLQLRGIDAELLVPEGNDIPLKERVRRANKITCQIGHPVQETIIVSIHVNAAPFLPLRRTGHMPVPSRKETPSRPQTSHRQRRW